MLRSEERPAISERPRYPFTAIVGQEQMRMALLLHAVHPGLGGVLVRGEKGTAKSTAVRALSGLLPAIDAVVDCPFGCDPADVAAACDTCGVQLQAGEQLKSTARAVPLVELPLGATEDRVLGSLDLESAIQSGLRRFEPGLLARANRGILYVDEVNLLPDHLVDILLDAAAMGRNYVEREGISASHPASFMLVGTMNPEEGDLRPQLLDRFALMAEVEGLHEPLERAEAVRRRIQFESDPRAFAAVFAQREQAEQHRIVRARALLASVTVPESMLALIVRICAEFDVDGLRADLAIYKAATALAAYDGRTEVGVADVRAAAALALPHRRRRRPFEETGLDTDELDRVIEESERTSSPSPAGATNGGDEASAQSTGASAATGQSESPPAGGSDTAEAPRIVPPAPALQALSFPMQTERRRQGWAGGRRAAAEHDRRGPPAGTAVPASRHFELALAASLRAAASHQRSPSDARSGPRVKMVGADLRQRLRKGRASSLVMFVVDASGSMGARDRMASTKAVVQGFLLDSYRKRDRVGLIAFRGTTAELLLPPTNSIESAERHLRFLPTGGTTPLAAGLDLAQTTIERATTGNGRRSPLLVLVSDGKANVSTGTLAPWESAKRSAERVRLQGWRSIVLNTERGRAGAGLGRAMATALGADYLLMDDLVEQTRNGFAGPGSNQQRRRATVQPESGDE